MGRLLDAAQVEQYRRDGFLHPVRVMGEDEAAELRRRLEAHEAATGGPLRGDLRHKAHLLFSWLCLLYTSPSPRDRTRSRMPSSA